MMGKDKYPCSQTFAQALSFRKKNTNKHFYLNLNEKTTSLHFPHVSRNLRLRKDEDNFNIYLDDRRIKAYGMQTK